VSGEPIEMEWVVLTQGGRPDGLSAAVASLSAGDSNRPVLVVSNGGGGVDVPGHRVRTLESACNLGVPGGRHLGVQSASAAVIGFLDDDAELRGDPAEIEFEFGADPRLGAVALRLIDEEGLTSRRHTPRAGSGDPSESGDVAYFLGGACAIRREAYQQIGGYFTELFYGHEEIELGWRLIDAGWKIRYLADVEVFHPRTEISRHADGWRLTGRNRVWIARRTLPWPVALVHVTVWLVLGAMRAPGRDCRRCYLAGWWSGWRGAVARHPIRWRTVVMLVRLGRPPII
jgi:GT2 family glycosyltransferase